MRRAIQKYVLKMCIALKGQKFHLNVVNLQNEGQLTRHVAIQLQDLLKRDQHSGQAQGRQRRYLGVSLTKAAAGCRVDGTVRVLQK